jgi:hypothetical protein
MTFTASDIGGCGVLDCDAAWAVLTFSNSTTVMVDFFEEGNCTANIDGSTYYSAWYEVGENDPAGPVSVTVFVQDGAGNTGSQQLINAVTIDNTAPVVENITVDETCVTLEDVVTICFDASDLGCGDFDDANLEVTVWYAETFWPGVYSDNEGNNYCFTFAVSGSETHPSGSYSVTVMATDDAGNETTETLEDAFQVVHAPVMAEWSVNGLDEECGVTNANPICFDFEFDREVFDFTASDIWVSFGFEVASVEGEGDSWTVCVNALSVSGTGTLYMYVSEVYDCAGNQYTAYDISANYDYEAPSGYTAMFTDSEGEEIDYINAMTCDEIYVTITGGVVGEVANWTIMVGEVEYSGWTLITSDPQTVNLSDPLITYDFTGPFATSNWDVLEEGNSMAAFSGNTILLLTGSNGSETPQANVDVTIVIPVDGTVSFDWDYETSDGPEWDPFGYLLNGNFFELTDEDGSDFQSGFEIYRADAETFEFVKIANVAGNVNGSTYKLLDDDLSLEVGKTYVYRLSYISKDGTIEDLSEILVPILTMPNSMQSIFVSQVTPNPVTDFGKLTVEMTNEQNLKIEIRNAAGQLVSVLSDQVRGAGVHNFNFDLTNRAQGSYSILISTDYEAIYVPFMYVK